MKKYMKYSTDIYNIYLKYFSADDIYVYKGEVVYDVNGFNPPTDYPYIPDIEYSDVWVNKNIGYGIKLD